MSRQINQSGLDLIEHFEGCKLDAYQDQGGIWTIGYGHTGNVQDGDSITQDQAEAFLVQDLTEAEQQVDDAVKSEINDNQFAALVSLAFNIGIGALSRSTLLADVNNSAFGSAAQEFLKWSHIGGIANSGLLRRRTAEKLLFETDPD
jgi:lysozyme